MCHILLQPQTYSNAQHMNMGESEHNTHRSMFERGTNTPRFQHRRLSSYHLVPVANSFSKHGFCDPGDCKSSSQNGIRSLPTTLVAIRSYCSHISELMSAVRDIVAENTRVPENVAIFGILCSFHNDLCWYRVFICSSVDIAWLSDLLRAHMFASNLTPSSHHSSFRHQ